LRKKEKKMRKIHDFPKAYSKNAQIPIEDFSERRG